MRGFFPNGSKLAISSMLVCYSFPTVPKHWRDCEKNQEKQKEDIWGNKLKKRKRGKKNLECTLIHTLFTIYMPYRLPCAPFYWSKNKMNAFTQLRVSMSGLVYTFYHLYNMVWARKFRLLRQCKCIQSGFNANIIVDWWTHKPLVIFTHLH